MSQYNRNNVHIDPSAYQHPADRKATEVIFASDAFHKALEFISKNSIERQKAIIYRSSLAELTPRTAPELCRMVEEAGDMFGASPKPVVFIERTYDLRIHIVGVEQPTLVISTELLKQTDQQALWGLVAAAVSCIRTGYCQISLVDTLCNDTNLLPSVITLPLKVLFQNWRRSAQFTQDRSNLIATGDLNASMRGILAGLLPQAALAGTNFKDPDCDFMQQSREFLARDGQWTEIPRDVKNFVRSENYYAARYMNLYQFAAGDYYDLIEEFAED